MKIDCSCGFCQLGHDSVSAEIRGASGTAAMRFFLSIQLYRLSFPIGMQCGAERFFCRYIAPNRIRQSRGSGSRWLRGLPFARWQWQRPLAANRMGRDRQPLRSRGGHAQQANSQVQSFPVSCDSRLWDDSCPAFAFRGPPDPARHIRRTADNLPLAFQDVRTLCRPRRGASRHIPAYGVGRYADRTATTCFADRCTDSWRPLSAYRGHRRDWRSRYISEHSPFRCTRWVVRGGSLRNSGNTLCLANTGLTAGSAQTFRLTVDPLKGRL